MLAKDIIFKQLLACHEQSNWFVPLSKAIEGVTEAQATWKSKEGTNSIMEIVNHLLYYNHRYLNQFRGISVEESIDNDETFLKSVEENWSATVKRMNNVMSEWIITLHDADEKRLNQWVGDLTHLTIHTSYHIGQIILIRKLQGSWDTRKGVH